MKAIQLGWIFGILACALPACGGDKNSADEDEYVSAVPEVSALQLSVTGDPTTEATATDDDAVDAREQIAEALDEASGSLNPRVAPELSHAREAVSALNQVLAGIRNRGYSVKFTGEERA